jgi:outer membrane lipoprotein-sorting protein
MKNLPLISILFLGTAMAFAQGDAPFKMKLQFSADLKMTMDDGQVYSSKMNMDNEKTRMTVEAQGQPMIMIIRRDLKKIYNVMPAQKMYMELPFNEQAQKAEQAVFDNAAKWEKVGTETIRNQVCDKYKVTLKEKATFVWINQSNKTPVRVATEDKKAVIDWENYKEGAQPAELFEPPSDCQKLALPEGMAMPGAGK